MNKKNQKVKVDSLDHIINGKIDFEYKKLWEVTIWNKKFNSVDKYKQEHINKIKSVSAKKLKELLRSNGDVKLLSTGIFDEYSNRELSYQYINSGEILSIPEGGRANIKYWKGDFVNSLNLVAISSNINEYNLKYIYYYLKFKNEWIQKKYRGSGVQHPNMGEILELNIPIPPLEIQKEIANILDKFTSYKAELEAELEYRKAQYEYYRNKLLDFSDEDVEYKSIGEICNIKRGRVISKKYIITNSGKFPVYSSQTMKNGEIGKINSYDFDGKFLTWTTDGAYAGTIFYREGKFSITNVCGLLSLKSNIVDVDLRFLYYILQINTRQHVNYKISNPKLMSNVMSEIMIPIPSLKKQLKIVNTLDKLNDIVNDISVGLPKEIELRQKQYEYYRNKLLSFKEETNE